MFFTQLAGHLGRDPETRFTPSGQKVTSFTMAINLRKGKEDVTVWVRITVWGDKFDKVISFLKKGSAVIVNGRMMPPSTYADKEGRHQVTLEVTAEMIEFSPFGKGDRAGAEQNNHGQSQSPQSRGAQSNQYAEAPSYGAGAPYQSQTGTGQGGYSSNEEDQLPF